MSTCSKLQDSPLEPWLDSINKQLEDISAHLSIHCMTQPPQKPTHSSVLSTGFHHPTLAALKPSSPQPHHDAHVMFNLAQKDPNIPAFTGMPHTNIINSIYDALVEVGFWVGTKTYILKNNVTKDPENILRWIWAIS